MARSPKKEQEPQNRKASLGVLFWIACILLVLVVFLLTRDNISSVLENTGFLEVITRGNDGTTSDGAAEGGADATPSGNGSTGTTGTSGTAGNTSIEVVGTQPSSDSNNTTSTNATNSTNTPQTPEVNAGTTTGTQATQGASDGQGSSGAAQPTVAGQRVRSYKLYFAKVNQDGNVSIEGRSREVSFVDSPLTATIQALLAGPSQAERDAGYVNAIPEGSQLISASIRGTTAFLDFNEAFSFNPLGYQTQRAQLQQVVFTATEFPTVTEVQFLIQGRKVNYLSGEGVFIGSPLQRGSF